MLYVHSMYWSVKALSTISSLPHPKEVKEYIYVILTMVIAVLLFAAIMGMVAHIVSSMHSARKEFQGRYLVKALAIYHKFRILRE